MLSFKMLMLSHIMRWPTTAICKYILYYCILYLSTQTYSLAVRVYLPVQQNIHQYNNMYPSTETLISVQKYIKTPVWKDISNSQYTNNSSSKKKNQSQYKNISSILEQHIHRLCDYILLYSKILVYNSTTIFIPVQKYKSQYKNKSCGAKS